MPLICVIVEPISMAAAMAMTLSALGFVEISLHSWFVYQQE